MIWDGLLGILEDAIQGVLDAFGGIVNALIEAWPIAMPDLPDLPSEMLTAWGWVLWTPLPVAAAIALLGFLVGVEILWQIIQIGLRWGRVVD